MCGIAGIFSQGLVDHRTVARLIGPIVHRGPDDEGIWIDPDVGIGLGHRRLSIVDLSPAGHQPMQSGDGRFVLSFNGEIYNHSELRRELEERDATPVGGWLHQVWRRFSRSDHSGSGIGTVLIWVCTVTG